ncbi:MAG: glycosyltransferase family 1 protein [Nostoc sp. GBBB01]|nr:glycosyltransferase family 1 protein [Nostoc sp. GBBB01]
MSTIVITSYGTLGDYLPYIALGKVLKTRGHQVKMVVNESIYPYVLKARLEPLAIGRPNLGPQEVQRHAKLWNHLPLLRTESPDKEKFISAEFVHDMRLSVDCLLEACNGADMVISCILQDAVAALVADIYDISYVRSSVTPFPLCFPRPETEEEIDAGSWENNKDFGRFILAASPYFCQLLPEYSQVYQTGFWFYEDPDWSSWEPSKELREFVEQEPKPLVLSYSSIPAVNPQEIVEVHVRAAAKLGRRIVIQQGWAGFNESYLPSDINRDKVMFLDGLISHDWLLSRAAAFITHGGVGSIARSLRNGCPVLVEPLGHDQFYNALQALKLGVGSVMDSQKLTVDGIANVLQKKILTPDYQKRAVEVGEKINAEQGLIVASDLIESWL